MERTVKKNSKEFTKAITSATEIKIYSLDNCFSGVEADEFPRWIRPDDFKLYAKGDAYKARVHSNLWIEFKAAA